MVYPPENIEINLKMIASTKEIARDVIKHRRIAARGMLGSGIYLLFK